MRMISQQLAEEMPDNSLPQECSRPWLRRVSRSLMKQEEAPEDPRIEGVILEDGMAHIEQ